MYWSNAEVVRITKFTLPAEFCAEALSAAAKIKEIPVVSRVAFKISIPLFGYTYPDAQGTQVTLVQT